MSEPAHATLMDGSDARALSRRGMLGELGALAFAGGAAAWLAGCARADRPPTAAYVSADDVLAREVFAAEFLRGASVATVFDTEATKTTGLERRLLAERDRPRADLFWSSEGFAAVRLARAGVLRPCTAGSDLERAWAAWPPPLPRAVVARRAAGRANTPGADAHGS